MSLSSFLALCSSSSAVIFLTVALTLYVSWASTVLGPLLGLCSVGACWYKHFGEQLAISYKINLHLPYGPAIPLLGVSPKRNENICLLKDLDMQVYGSIFHDRAKLDTSKISTNR